MLSKAATVGAAGAVVSMVTGTGVAALVLPAGSVALTLRLLRPSAKAVVGVMAQVPPAATTAVPSTVVPLGAYRVMVSPGVAPAPLMVGVSSLVMLSVLLGPVSLAVATSAAGAAGGVVSMVTGTVVAGLVLPAGSVAVTLMLFRPSGSALVGVAAQVPLLATTTVWTSPPGKVTVMVSPAVPVPLRVGVLSLVMRSVSLTPVSLAAAKTATGAAGALVSMVMGSAAAGPVLPAGSVAVTLRAFRPSGSALVGVADQLPLALTTAVATTLPAASLTVMVSPATPVPLSVGVLSLVRLSPRVPVSLTVASAAVGAAGALVSMVTGTVVGALTLPAGSVAVTLMLLTPSASSVLGVTLQLPSAATTAVCTSPPGKVTVMVSPGVPAPPMVGVLSAVMLSPTVPESLMAASAAAGAAGGVVSSTKLPERAGLMLPAMSVTVVLVVQLPSSVKALLGMTWLMLPAAMSAAVSTWLSVRVLPSGKVTTVVTVSPTAASPGRVTAMGVPPLLRASAALTPFSASGKATPGAPGGEVSSTKLPLCGVLTLPAGSVTVVRVVQLPSTVKAVDAMVCVMVKGPVPVAVPPWDAGNSPATMTWVNTLVLPLGLVTTVVTVSPTLASAGKVTTIGVPPLLRASAALMPPTASGKATVGALGARVSTSRFSVSVPVTP